MMMTMKKCSSSSSSSRASPQALQRWWISPLSQQRIVNNDYGILATSSSHPQQSTERQKQQPQHQKSHQQSHDQHHHTSWNSTAHHHHHHHHEHHHQQQRYYSHSHAYCSCSSYFPCTTPRRLHHRIIQHPTLLAATGSTPASSGRCRCRCFSSTKNGNSGQHQEEETGNKATVLTSSSSPIAVTRNDKDHASSSTTVSFTLDNIPGSKTGKSRKLVIIFTCAVCETRSVKQFSESAPVVLVRCPGCQNLHLLVDRLGWFDNDDDDEFGKKFDIIEQIKTSQKKKMRSRINHDDDNDDNDDSGGGVLELTLEELVGSKEKVDKLLHGENKSNNGDNDKNCNKKE